MEYIENSQSVTGYKVGIAHRGEIKLKGFTLIVPHDAGDRVGQFWDELLSDGRIEKLLAASATPTPMLGLGSWDSECDRKGGFRFSICIEETEHTNFEALEKEYPLFAITLGESDWMCFETDYSTFMQRFWKDDPYKMMRSLGYIFNARGKNTGLHFEVYPPGFDPGAKPYMELWITVRKRPERARPQAEKA